MGLFFLILLPYRPFSLGTGTAVVMSGLWAPAPPTSDEAYELRVDEVRILGPTDAEVSAKIYVLYASDLSIHDIIPSEDRKN